MEAKETHKKPSEIMVKTISSNHAQVPEVIFDPDDKFWSINMRPKGPGLVLVNVNDRHMRRFAEAYCVAHGLAMVPIQNK